MTKLPTPKQRRIVKAKIKGYKHDEIAAHEYPKAKPENRRSIISQELHKPHVAQYYEQSKLIALKESNITWKRVTDAISRGLDDDNKYLQAAKQAGDLLNLPKETKDDELKDKLISIAQDADEIQLIRALKTPKQS